MSNLLANQTAPRGSMNRERALAWQLRDVLGFDPFHTIRTSVEYDYEVRRTDTGYEVEIPCPGFNSSQIEISVKDEILNVSGKNERRSFSRSFALPEDVDVEAIEAKARDGVLMLSLPRLPETQPKKISVK